MKLNEIQEASVEHILKVLKKKQSFSIITSVGDGGCYCVPTSPPFPRYLLADEVGLGKTITTAGVIKKLADEKKNKEPEKPFNVYYICGNERITNQNKKRLEECCGDTVEIQNERLTMQPQQTGAGIRIFPITPAVAFTSKNSRFHEKEFDAICKIYQDKYANNLPPAVKSAMDRIKGLWVEKNNAKGKKVTDLPTPTQLLAEITGTLGDPQLDLELQAPLFSVKKVLLASKKNLTSKMSEQIKLIDTLMKSLEFSDTLNKIQELSTQDKYSEQQELLNQIYLMFTNNFDRVTELHRKFQILRKHAFHLQVTELNPPDLIVLDEFQNYSELIEAYHLWQERRNTSKNYFDDESTTEQDDKPCYPRFNLMMDSAPVLLLSATPFDVVSKDVHDTDEYETPDQSQEQDEQEDDEQEDDKDEDFMPAEGLKSTEDSFASVFRFITGVKYDPDSTNHHKKPTWLYENMFCRTQRSNFYEVNQESMIVERFPTMEQTVAHMDYNKILLGVAKNSPEYPLLSPKNMLEESEATMLEEMTYATLDPLLQTSMSENQKLNWVKISPTFVNFSSWYESIFKGTEGKNKDSFTYTPTMLSTVNHGSWGKCTNHGTALEDSLALGAKGHGGYEFLKETVLPEGVEDMLWIPPVISHSMAYQNDKNPFWKNKDYSKTLVFTKYRMSTQSLAYFMCQEREKRCKIYNQNSAVFKLDPKNLPDGYFKRAVDNISQKNKKLKDFLIDLFNENMPLIQRVTGETENEAVNEYAQMGGLMAVIEEYLFVAGETACPVKYTPLDQIETTKGGKKKVKGTKDDAFTPSQVTVLLEKGKMFDGNDPKKTIKPFLGFADRFTADLGDVKGNSRKEESNLQDRFNSPFFPFMMTATSTAQEGLDFHNYSHNMLHFSMPETPVVFRQREGRIDRRRCHLMRKRLREYLNDASNSMAVLYRSATAQANPQVQQSEKENPLFPDWYVPDVPNIYYSRQVWAMPVSIEKSHFQKMKVAQKKYDTFLGERFFSTGNYKDHENAFCPFLQQKNKTP